MKKTLILSVALLTLPVFAQAATIRITPATQTVTEGQKATLTVSVDPAGANISAVSVHLAYTAAALTADSFSFSNAWVPVTQGGYDQMGSGTVIKTAGYPGGTASSSVLGTITFTARASGRATVTVDQAASLVYDANTVNVLAGSQGNAVVNIVPARRAAQNTAGTGTTNNSATTTATSTNVTGGAEASTSIATTSTSTITAQTAAAALAGIAGAWWKWLLAALGVLLVLVGLWYAFRRRS